MTILYPLFKGIYYKHTVSKFKINVVRIAFGDRVVQKLVSIHGIPVLPITELSIEAK